MTFVLDTGILGRLCHPHEDLIRFLRKDLVAVRLYEGGYRRDGWNARSCA